MKKTLSCTGVFWLLILIVLSSCQFPTPEKSESVPVQSAAPGTNSEREFLAILKARANHTITFEELEALVSDFINPQQEGRSLAPEEKTAITGVSKLSAIGGKRFSVNTQDRSTTDTNEEQETVEVYNFITQKPGSDTPGYVLASNDLRVGNILGIAEAGSLDNEELSWFSDIVYEGISGYIDRRIEMYDSITEDEMEQAVERSVARLIGSTASSGSVDYPFGYFGPYGYFRSRGYTGTIVAFYYSWTDGYYAPLPVEWKQSGPYNYVVNAYKNTGYDYPAGCGPVAVAQLMAFHQKPSTCTWNEYVSGLGVNFNNYVYNWPLMTNTVQKTDINDPGALDIAVLMYEIGRRANADYQTSGTGVYQSGIRTALQAMGYNTPAFIPYDFSTIKTSIQNNRPVIITGAQAANEGGHVWVIDAVRRMEYYEDFIDSNGNRWTISNPGSGPGHSDVANDWVHCNLGGGVINSGQYHAYNAWYVSGVFDCRLGYQALARAGTPLVFVYSLQILPNVY